MVIVNILIFLFLTLLTNILWKNESIPGGIKKKLLIFQRTHVNYGWPSVDKTDVFYTHVTWQCVLHKIVFAIAWLYYAYLLYLCTISRHIKGPTIFWISRIQQNPSKFPAINFSFTATVSWVISMLAIWNYG